MSFSHEKLIVYQKAIAFVAWADPLIQQLPSTVAAKDQLDRASTSVPLNIAEGNGKFSAKDRARYFQIAQGSALESAAALDVIVAKKRVSADGVLVGKALLEEVVNMLMTMLDRLSCRVAEDSADAFGEED